MNHRIGDKVKIKKHITARPGEDKCGPECAGWASDMDAYIGSTVTIREFMDTRNYYLIKEDGEMFGWSDCMLVGKPKTSWEIKL